MHQPEEAAASPSFPTDKRAPSAFVESVPRATAPQKVKKKERPSKRPEPVKAAPKLRTLPPSSKHDSATRWISLSIGKDDGFNPRDILDLIAGAAGVPANTVGTIELKDSSCVFEIERQHATQVMKSLEGAPLKGRPLELRLLPNPAKPSPEDKPSSGKPTFLKRGGKKAKGGKKKNRKRKE